MGGELADRIPARPARAAPAHGLGLVVIALSDVASVMTSAYGVFLGFRALAGVGWAMFGTVATTTMVDLPAAQRRGRAVSLLMMSETSGLLLGTAAGGWLYQGLGVASPFVFEAACLLAAAILVARWALPPASQRPAAGGWGDRHQLGAVLRAPGVLDASVTNAVLTVIQTGVLVFLFPLYLVNRGGLGPEAVGVLTSVSILGRLVALWVGGSVSDRWGRMRVLVAGLLAYAALLGSVPFLTHPVALSLWSLALGVAAGFVAPLPTAVVGDRVLPPLHGLAIGWLRTMTDSGQILGPLVMGACADAVGSVRPISPWRRTAAGDGVAVRTPGETDAGDGHDRGKRMTRANDRVMVVTAHPDDPEFGAGGTVAKLAKEGREVTYVIVTNGNRGSSDSASPPSGRGRAMPAPRGATR